MIHGLINVKCYSNNQTQLKQMQEHIQRKHMTYKNKNIDYSRLKENVIIKKTDDTYTDKVNKIIKEHDMKLQKNTSVVLGVVIKLNEENGDDLSKFTKDDYIKILTAQQDKFIKSYNIDEDCILDSTIHFDEMEPHLHLTFIPKITVEDKEKNEQEREMYLQKECSKKARAELKKEVSAEEFAKLPTTKVILDIIHKNDTSKITEDNKDILMSMRDKYSQWRDKAEKAGWGINKKNAGKVVISKAEMKLGGKKDFKKLQDMAFEWTKESLKEIGKEEIQVARKFHENSKYVKDIEEFKKREDIKAVKEYNDKDKATVKEIEEIKEDYQLETGLMKTYKKDSVDTALKQMKNGIMWLKDTVKKVILEKNKIEKAFVSLKVKYDELKDKYEKMEKENNNLTKNVEKLKFFNKLDEFFYKKLEEDNQKKEKLDKFESELKEKQNYIIRRDNELLKKENELNVKKESLIHEYNKKIDILNTNISNKDYVSALKTFKESDVLDSIERIEKEYSAKQKSIDEYDSKVQKYETTLEEQANKIQLNDVKISADSNKIKKNGETIKEQEKILANQMKQINENQIMIDEINQHNLKIKEKTKKIKELEKREAELEKSNKKYEGLKNKIDELDTKVKIKEQKLSKINGLLELESYFKESAGRNMTKYYIKKGFDEDTAEDKAFDFVNKNFGMDLVLTMKNSIALDDIFEEDILQFESGSQDYSYIKDM